MPKPLRLLNRQPKPRRKCGLINSDEVVGRHQRQYDEMVVKYRIDPTESVPLWRRAWRRLWRISGVDNNR